MQMQKAPKVKFATCWAKNRRGNSRWTSIEPSGLPWPPVWGEEFYEARVRFYQTLSPILGVQNPSRRPGVSTSSLPFGSIYCQEMAWVVSQVRSGSEAQWRDPPISKCLNLTTCSLFLSLNDAQKFREMALCAVSWRGAVVFSTHYLNLFSKT